MVTYALTSANDHDARDPKDWTLKGSADGKDWKTLDTRAGETFAERFQTKSYDIADADDGVPHYRLEITKNNGADITQLADVQFSNGDTSTPTPDDMRSLVDRGPTAPPPPSPTPDSPESAPCGTRAPTSRTAGPTRTTRSSTSTRPSRRDTELSYRIFPSMPETDLNYPATNVSVDLAFTDGTYLSDLQALDQHGGLLTPQGQGAAKRLYVNQWNQVALRDRLGRGRQDGRPDPGGVRLPEGPGEVPGLDRRHRARPRRPREKRAGASVGLRGRPPAAPTPAAASRAATTSRRPPCRTASTSGRR